MANVIPSLGRLGCAAVFLACPAVAQKVPDVRLNTNAPGVSSSTMVRIAASGSAVFAIWRDDRNGLHDIYFNRSLDRGSTWLASDVRVNTDAPGVNFIPEAEIAASGMSVYVAWIDTRNGATDVYFNRSLDGGTTWLASDVRLDTDPPGSKFSTGVKIAASGASVVVVWHDSRNGFLDIYANVSLDSGTTWLASDVRLDTDGPGAANSWAQDVAARGSSFFATWLDRRNGGSSNDVYFNRSVDGGTTWLTQDVRLNTVPPGAGMTGSARLAVSGPAVYAVWLDHRNGLRDVYFNRSLDSGVTWLSSDVRVNHRPPAALYFDMAASGASVYVAWNEYGSGSSELYFNRSLDGGKTWFGEDVRVDEADSGGRPSLAAQGSSVYLAWGDGRDIYFDRSLDRGATWLAEDRRLDTGVPAGVSSGYEPKVAATPEGAYVAWYQNRTPFYADVFFNIPFGLQRYGPGLAGSAGLVPRLDGNGLAHPGARITLDATNALGAAIAVVTAGSVRASIPFLGGTLLLQPTVALGFPIRGAAGVPGAGWFSLPLEIPDLPVFLGAAYFFQVLVVDPGAVQGVSMSNGVELWIG